MVQTRNTSTQGIYQPLDKTKKEIRLLEIRPGRFDSTVRCRLKRAYLQGTIPNYETISYCWGDAKLRSEIVLNGVRVDVPRASARALQGLRLKCRPRTVWIDAVCINQGNDQERGHQVGMMCDVYRNGRCNLIYLGDYDIAKAAESIYALIEHDTEKGLSTVVRNPSNGAFQYLDADEKISVGYDVEALIELFSDPWFSRLWVVQEAVLSQRNVVYCGSTTLELRDVLRAADSLLARIRSTDHDLWKVCRDLSSFNGLVMCAPDIDFTRCLITSRDHLVSEPVDHVYGLLGLLPELEIEPDYHKSPSQVFEEATREVIRFTSSISHLTAVSHDSDYAESCSQISDLPSWVYQFNRPWNNSTDPTILRSRFRAHGGFGHATNFEGDEKDTCGPLRTSGFIVGIVQQHMHLPVDPGFSFDNLDEMIVGALGLGTEKHLSAEEMTALTLCAETDANFQPMGNPDAVEQYSVWRSHIQRGVDVPMVNEINDSMDKSLVIAANYDEAVRRACHNREFFTTSNGYFGLGPKLMKAGDIAVVLFGLSVPAILRPVGDKYRFLAVGYVCDIMNGEWCRDQTQRGIEAQVFDLI